MIKTRLILAVAIGVTLAERGAWAIAPPPSVQWSMNGSAVAVVSGSLIEVFNSSGTRIKTQQLDAVPDVIALSPDGTKIAYVLTRQAWVLDLGSGSKTQIFASADATQFCNDLQWGPTGQNLTYTVISAGTNNQGNVYMVQADGSGKVLLLTFKL